MLCLNSILFYLVWNHRLFNHLFTFKKRNVPNKKKKKTILELECEYFWQYQIEEKRTDERNHAHKINEKKKN